MDEIARQLSPVLGILVAAALGAVIGWEREAKGKIAGFRTHILVALTSALFVVLGEVSVYEIADAAPGDSAPDPIRMIQAVAIGIGFIGSGVVRSTRPDEGAGGLTTAASIWAASAIGVAAAFELYALATAVTVLVVLVLRVLGRFEPPHTQGR